MKLKHWVFVSFAIIGFLAAGHWFFGHRHATMNGGAGVLSGWGRAS